MKKSIFFAAIAACMGIMTSCSQDDDYVASSGVDNNAIAFSTKSNDVMTRSGQTINSVYCQCSKCRQNRSLQFGRV